MASKTPQDEVRSLSNPAHIASELRRYTRILEQDEIDPECKKQLDSTERKLIDPFSKTFVADTALVLANLGLQGLISIQVLADLIDRAHEADGNNQPGPFIQDHFWPSIRCLTAITKLGSGGSNGSLSKGNEMWKSLCCVLMKVIIRIDLLLLKSPNEDENTFKSLCDHYQDWHTKVWEVRYGPAYKLYKQELINLLILNSGHKTRDGILVNSHYDLLQAKEQFIAIEKLVAKAAEVAHVSIDWSVDKA